MEFDWGGMILAVAGLVLTGYLIPWIRSKLGAAELEQIRGWVKVAVLAAEQLFGSGTGSRKKEYVLEWLAQRGVKLSQDELDAMIEAAVFELTK